MGSIGRGVLDTRFRGYDGGGWDARFCLVIARSEATKQSILSLSFRGDATGSRECAPDDRFRIEPGIWRFPNAQLRI
jgi:hypothetical protein